MELSAIQIVTTVVLIVAAGAVALFCDYLRNRSQQLQQVAVELGPRNEMPVATPAAPVMAPSAASSAAARTARAMAAREEKVEAVPSAPPRVAEIPAPPTERHVQLPERHSAEMVQPALASAAEITSVRGAARPRRRPLPPHDAPLPRLEDMNPRQALSEWLDQRAAKPPVRRAEPVVAAPVAVEELTVTAPPPAVVEESAPVVPTASEEPAPVVATVAEELAPVVCDPVVEEFAPVVCDPVVEQPVASSDVEDIRDILRRAKAKRHIAPAPTIEVAAVDAAPSPVAVTAPISTPAPAPQPAPVPVALPAPAKTVSVVQKKVSVFLNTRKIDTYLREEVAAAAPPESEIAPVEAVAAAEPRFEIINGAASSSNSLEVTLPAGMHDRAALDRAIATGKPFRGLVVAVGVNDVEGRSARNNDLMQSIGFFVRGLLSEKEFACRSGEAEFLILCPELEGAKAQERLTHIAEQLWDYQLRGVSTWSILFSWGGADVHCQRLPEAIAAASEQMNNTRRGRKMVSVDAFRPWRKAAM